MDAGITSVKGISDKRAALFLKLGVASVEDLVNFYPRNYIDYTENVDISTVEIGSGAVIKASVVRKMKPIFSARVTIYKLLVTDGGQDFVVTFFNSEYSYSRLIVGEQYLFYGKVTGSELAREMSGPLFISVNDAVKILPRYHLTAGLSHNIIASCVKNALVTYEAAEIIPEEIAREHALISRKDALCTVHFPDNNDVLTQAKRRLVFEELLILQLSLLRLKNHNRRLTAAEMRHADMTAFYRALPFAPTNAQLRAVEEATADLCRPVPMNRLLQGDVGSGKTMVAAALCYFSVVNGWQCALMAPTEILAKQHCATLEALLAPLDINVVLLTGALPTKEKKSVYESIASGEANVVVGTQALIQKQLVFRKLGLIITDEQHRFGVTQRDALAEKGQNPHVIVMSATPIPRTLALIIYADLDISVLNEMPRGRKPIATYAVDGSFRERLYNFALKHIAAGEQVYIVVPVIGDGDDEDSAVNERVTAVKLYNELKNRYFSGVNVGLLHGRMKQAEKDAVMSAFKNRETDALVSTTVIEVGIDVPNATVMLIENAERFGLSQLHQLRGRVGRGDAQSYCALIFNKNKKEGGNAGQRGEIMEKTGDGFAIAEEDLKLRGPGDFFGSKQHGLPLLKTAALSRELDLLTDARAAALAILASDPDLKRPENQGLQKKIEDFQLIVNN